jgi:hypothetical protein
MQANQLRMSFSAMAYVLVDTLRRVGLRHSQFADAAVATIRLKLLKLGAQGRIRARPHLPSACLQLRLSDSTQRKHQACPSPC